MIQDCMGRWGFQPQVNPDLAAQAAAQAWQKDLSSLRQRAAGGGILNNRKKAFVFKENTCMN